MKRNPEINSEDKRTVSSPQDNKNLIKDSVNAYGDGMFNALGNIIKAIAFILAFAIIILSFFAAFFFFTIDNVLSPMALAVIIGGTVLAAILFFPIYGLGHVVNQNNEILKRLNGK